MASIISKGFGFIRKQPRDWKVTVARQSLCRFFYQLNFPYQSIYIVGLGASATQLGIVNTAGLAVGGLLAPLAGWLVDRTGTKIIYLLGLGLIAVSYLTYGVAQGWTIIIVAMIVYWLGFRVSGTCCSVICANSLLDENRATGMNLCSALSSALVMVSPMLGALLITTFGGVNVSGIRPLFFISFIGMIIAFILILTQLSNRRWGSLGEAKPSFLQDISQVFKHRHNLKRWIVISSMTYMPWGMVLPFTQIFAHEVKGAEQYILGAMVTGMGLTTLALGIPIGRLADRIGRKKILYFIAPFSYASSLMLIWAPSPGFLIAAGVLQGFFILTLPITGAMSAELVPPDQMGRWMGVLELFRGLIAAGAALLAGAIWDNIGPQYLFLSAIGLDLLIRIPLLIGMPETLGSVRTAEYEE